MAELHHEVVARMREILRNHTCRRCGKPAQRFKARTIYIPATETEPAKKKIKYRYYCHNCMEHQQLNNHRLVYKAAFRNRTTHSSDAIIHDMAAMIDEYDDREEMTLEELLDQDDIREDVDTMLTHTWKKDLVELIWLPAKKEIEEDV